MVLIFFKFILVFDGHYSSGGIDVTIDSRMHLMISLISRMI